MVDPASLLICGAFEGEIDKFSKYKNINVLNSGIGSYDSMFNLMSHLLRNRNIRSVIFTGSAGAYPHSELSIGDFVCSNAFFYREVAEIKAMAKVPSKLNRNIITQKDPELVELFAPCVNSGTNSLNYITLVDLQLPECIDYLFDVGVENMEAFGLAYIAYKFSVPFTAFYYITNYVGSEGSNDWAANWREGSDALQDHIIKSLHL
ncbi:MAG: hypothetical protein AAF518_21660 [Spirochaetota bacterium]